jgi:hypothetical protein
MAEAQNTVETIAAEPPFPVELVYGCGCRDTWLAFHEPEEAVHTIDVPCVPESCATCRADGVCKTRQSMLNYQPTAFAEIGPVRRVQYRRVALGKESMSA